MAENFPLKDIVAKRLGENYDLHERYVNRTLVSVLRTIGFDKIYARAEGCYLYDIKGDAYLDFLSGYGVYNIGRNHPVVKQTIRDLLDLDLPNMVQMDCALLSGLLAEKVSTLMGHGLDSCFFGNSGTEVNEAAIKFARSYTGRPRMISFKGSYHGLSYGALSLTQNNNFQEGFGPFLPGVAYVELGDLAALEAELSKKDVAGFIVEPIQGKGVHFVDGDYWPKARELCRKYGTMFIADEVQTGMGRTGKMWCYQHWGLDPDIVTFAKALSGGFAPVGGIVTRREIYQGVYSRMDRAVVHSSTFGRNNLAMACGLATFHIMEQDKLVEKSAAQGEKLMARIRELQKKHELIKEVRGKGCMIAIEFQKPSSLLLRMAWKIFDQVDKGLFAQMIVHGLMHDEHVLTQVAGHNMDVIKILPPLTISDKEIDLFVNGLDRVLARCGSPVGPMWTFGTNLARHALAAKKARSETKPVGA